MLHQKKFTVILAFAIMLIPFTTFKSFGQELLAIKITNVKKNKGNIVVEIYNSKQSWLKTPFRKMVLPGDQDVQTASFQVPYGKYAITIYQDLNNNGEPDMNFLGIPKELIGFGNNYKPFGEPKFKSSSILFETTSKSQEIKLYKVF